jgi:hypothetical protein
MTRDQRAVWVRIMWLLGGLLAVSAIAWWTPHWRSLEARNPTAGLFQEPPAIVCLLADPARRQVRSPILSCPARRVG